MITFVAPAFNEVQHKCPLINSLLSQKDDKWECIVYHNGPNQPMKVWIESFRDSRLRYRESATNTGQWGCLNRQDAISKVTTPYIINTSIQDYYTPNAVQDIMMAVEQSVDLIHWQAINHLFNYNIISGEIAFGHIDWGQWCTRTEYLKRTGIVKPAEFTSDWQTLQAILQQGLVQRVHKINLPLCLHL